MSEPPLRRWLIVRLEGPLIAFGGVAIDHRGVTRDFPAVSMLTGLFANALGWERPERAAHQALQDRLVFAARRDRESYRGVLRDTQNAKLEKSDKGWTTRGEPEGRGGNSYDGPHRRQRDYHPDALVIVAVTLSPMLDPLVIGQPTLDDLAAALDRPARPIFIGRKPCLPSSPLRAGFVEAATAHAALSLVPRGEPSCDPVACRVLRAVWPASEGPNSGPDVERTTALADLRNWHSGLHGGTRLIVEGLVRPRHQEAP